MSSSHFCEWLFGAENFSGLSRNARQARTLSGLSRNGPERRRLNVKEPEKEPWVQEWPPG